MHIGRAAKCVLEHKIHHSFLQRVLCKIAVETRLKGERKGFWDSKGRRREKRTIHAE
jgi:hypothetical protein